MPQVYSRLTPVSSISALSAQLFSTYKPTLAHYQRSFLKSSCFSLIEKICEVVKFILFNGLGLGLYWANPTLFAIGFITGIIYDENVSNAILKVKLIWQTQTWTSCLMLGIASFLSLPVTLAASTFMWGAHLGCKIAQVPVSSADEKLEMLPVDGNG